MLDRKNNHSHFAALINRLRQTNLDVIDLVEFLSTRKKIADFEPINCFRKPDPEDFHGFSKSLPTAVNNAEKLCWQLIDGQNMGHQYMPIRAFRASPASLWGSVDKLRIFRSSGTTSGPDGRSWSGFSEEGRRFYKASCLTSFFGVLETRLLPFTGDFLNMSLISLIPPVEKWPDSSLAQMIAWFGEVWPLAYAAEDSPHVFQALTKQMSPSANPLCIAGTAFHFVNFLDAWSRLGLPKFSLPPGSFLIETGGTKGKSRAIERSELYALMSDAFNLNESFIVSEYGMCELASQAWDFADTSGSSENVKRSFKFPWWVKTAVMTHPSRSSPVGEGALLIQDFARVDLYSSNVSLPIQTEDLAHLALDGSFSLRGRVPFAPLKGCSMRAEQSDTQIGPTLERLTRTRSNYEGPLSFQNQSELDASAALAHGWFRKLISDSEAKKRLAEELQSVWLAEQALSDLAAGLPDDVPDFVRAAINSKGGRDIAKRWLFISPASHSLALIHPIAAALALNLSIRVRVPKIAEILGSQTFLARALELAKAVRPDLTVLDAHWRLGHQDLLDGEQLLVFGDDDTCSTFNSFAPGRVRCFGNALSLTIARADDLNRDDVCKRIMGDQLSLRQRGCLSSRAIIVIGGSTDVACDKLTHALPHQLLDHKSTAGGNAARAMELVRLRQLGFNNHHWSSLSLEVPSVLIAAKNLSLDAVAPDLLTALSRLDLVIPVVVIPETISEIEIITNFPKQLAVKALGLSDEFFNSPKELKYLEIFPKKLQLRRHGELDRPKFDGSHLGEPFFGTGA